MKVEWHGVEFESKVEKEMDKIQKRSAQRITRACKNTTAFTDKTKHLRSHMKALKSKFGGGGHISHIDSPHAYLVEMGHDQYAGGKKGEGGEWVRYVWGKGFMRAAVEIEEPLHMSAMKNYFRDK